MWYIEFIEYFSLLADAWPQVFDDSEARRDWKWEPKYNLDKLVDLMVRDVKENYLKKESNVDIQNWGENDSGESENEQQQNKPKTCCK